MKNHQRFHVNVIHPFAKTLFLQYKDFFDFDGRIEFQENDYSNRMWDLVIIFEGLNKPVTITCRTGNLMFMSGEPEETTSYSSKFIKQFEIAYSIHKVAKTNMQYQAKQHFNDWHFGYNHSSGTFKYTYKELKNLPKPEKTRPISIVCSNLQQLPLHAKRLKLIEEIKKHFSKHVDFYGRGFNFIEDKADALLPYRFHICIENTKQRGLWTEKLADPFLAYTVPIYDGCLDVLDYFSSNSLHLINVNNIEDSLNKIEKILHTSEKQYEDKLESIIESRSKVINEYSMYGEIRNIAKRVENKTPEYRKYTIEPNSTFLSSKYKNMYLKCRCKLHTYIFKYLGLEL